MFNFFKISAKIIGLIFIIVFALILLFAYLSSFTESDKSWVLFANLIMPYVYAVNLVIFLVLIAKFSFIKAIIPFSMLVLTFNTTTTMYGINFLKKYDNSRSKFKIMTYNVHSFRDQQWVFKYDSVMNEIDSINPDIVLFQEFQVLNIPLDTIKKRLSKLKYTHIHLSSTTSTKQEKGNGNATFSKYPLINQKNLDFEESDNKAIISNIIINDDTLTLINAHLQSSGIGITDRNKIQNIEDSVSLLIKDTTIYNNILKPIYNKLIDNNKKRRLQTDILAKEISDSKYPVIICGDFNSVPSSYSYRKFTSKCDLKDPFMKYGKAYESTFRMFNNLLRIDYILHSEKYNSVSFKVLDLEYSDHNPVVVELSKN